MLNIKRMQSETSALFEEFVSCIIGRIIIMLNACFSLLAFVSHLSLGIERIIVIIACESWMGMFAFTWCSRILHVRLRFSLASRLFKYVWLIGYFKFYMVASTNCSSAFLILPGCVIWLKHVTDMEVVHWWNLNFRLEFLAAL